MKTVLVIDDSREFTELIGRHLERRGHEVHSAYSGAGGLGIALTERPDLVLLDLHLGDMPGLEVLTRLKATLPEMPVVIVTGHPELSSALAAIRGSVVDYLCKPFPSEELDAVLDRVFKTDGSAAAPEPRGDALHGSDSTEMIGGSRATAELRKLIAQLAATGVRAALITGESGTGKDLAARMFHAASLRARGAFIEVNCSAISEGLFESEFFGHERGAFTGAVGAKRGLAEMADGGTLFLDEVGEIPLSCQPKLLRFLEDQSFFRVGGNRKIKVDVQVIAATNRDLRAMVEQWVFRPDLYFRLNVVPIVIPPLRERPADVLPLAAFWLREANARYKKSVHGLTPDAEARLLAYAWPGNVRELRNLVERLVILCQGDAIDAGQLPPEIAAATTAPAPADAAAAGTATVPPVTGEMTLEEVQRAHIQSVLARVNGNKTKAAGILGISRETLRGKIGP